MSYVKLNGITGWRVLKDDAKKEPVPDTRPADPAPVQTNADRKASRPEVLDGKTYKLRVPSVESAYYITISDDADGRPFEIFISTRDADSHQWIALATRLISAMLRSGISVDLIIEEMCYVADPNGGFFSAREHRLIPSLVAAIGYILRSHCHPKPKVAVVANENQLGATCPKCGMNTLVKESGCEVCRSCDYSRCG